jgi:predicted nucleic acid-binding protein
MQSIPSRSRIAVHPFVIGEIALGSLRNRQRLMDDFHDMKSLPLARDDEVVRLIENKKLYGRGVGYIDCHLIASVLLSGARLWSDDKRMLQVATELGIAI